MPDSVLSQTEGPLAFFSLRRISTRGNAHGAEIFAFFAVGAEVEKPGRLVGRAGDRREKDADSSRIYRTSKDVAADRLEDRALQHAAAAFQAVQDLFEIFVRGDIQPAVVDDDDVDFLRSVDADDELLFDIRRLAGPRDEGDIRRQLEARGGHRQGLDQRDALFHGFDELLGRDQRNMDRRQRGDQARVALIADDDESAGLGDGQVSAGNPDVRLGEISPHFLAGDLDHFPDIGGDGPAQMPREISATSSFVLWRAGAVIWEGRSPASCTIHSPRSVSTTR